MTNRLTAVQKATLERLATDRLYLDGPDKLWIGGGKGPNARTLDALAEKGRISFRDCSLLPGSGARLEVIRCD